MDSGRRWNGTAARESDHLIATPGHIIVTSPESPEPAAIKADTGAAHPSLAGHAARGVGWLILQMGGTRVVAVVAQVVLAWLLRREDFGLLSKAFTVAALPGLLYQVGLREVLLGRTTGSRRLDR